MSQSNANVPRVISSSMSAQWPSETQKMLIQKREKENKWQIKLFRVGTQKEASAFFLSLQKSFFLLPIQLYHKGITCVCKEKREKSQKEKERESKFHTDDYYL